MDLPTHIVIWSPLSLKPASHEYKVIDTMTQSSMSNARAVMRDCAKSGLYDEYGDGHIEVVALQPAKRYRNVKMGARHG